MVSEKEIASVDSARSALGKGYRIVPSVNFLGLMIWFLDRVTIGWEGSWSVAGEGLGTVGMMWVEADTVWSYVLWVEVLPNSIGLILSQTRYIIDLLKKTKMLEAKPISSPMAQSASLSAFEGDPLDDVTLYRNTVGALKYLSLTCPDISFIVNKLSQFMHCPTSLHWQSVKCHLRYLKQTIHLGLQLKRSKFNTLQAFSDVD